MKEFISHVRILLFPNSLSYVALPVREKIMTCAVLKANYSPFLSFFPM